MYREYQAAQTANTGIAVTVGLVIDHLFSDRVPTPMCRAAIHETTVAKPCVY
jgi:hypothetical protein